MISCLYKKIVVEASLVFFSHKLLEEKETNSKMQESDHFVVTLPLQAKDKALKEKIIEIHEEYAALVVSAFFEYDHVTLLSSPLSVSSHAWLRGWYRNYYSKVLQHCWLKTVKRVFMTILFLSCEQLNIYQLSFTL